MLPNKLQEIQEITNMLISSVKCVSKKFDFVKMSQGISDIYETSTHSGEDAWFIGKNIVGVADGVSGWNTKGVASAFSSSLMMECDKYSRINHDAESIQILERGYYATLNNVIGGSSTVCIAKMKGDILDVVNHGDSGLIIIRDKQIIHMTTFDYIEGHDSCPCQLGKWELNEDELAPVEHDMFVNRMYSEIGRRIADTKLYKFSIQHNDIVIMGTDGFFDNMPAADIIECLNVNNIDVNKISSILMKKAIQNTLLMNPDCIDDITIIVSQFDNTYDSNDGQQGQPCKKRHKSDI